MPQQAPTLCSTQDPPACSLVPAVDGAEPSSTSPQEVAEEGSQVVERHEDSGTLPDTVLPEPSQPREPQVERSSATRHHIVQLQQVSERLGNVLHEVQRLEDKMQGPSGPVPALQRRLVQLQQVQESLLFALAESYRPAAVGQTGKIQTPLEQDVCSEARSKHEKRFLKIRPGASRSADMRTQQLSAPSETIDGVQLPQPMSLKVKADKTCAEASVEGASLQHKPHHRLASAGEGRNRSQAAALESCSREAHRHPSSSIEIERSHAKASIFEAPLLCRLSREVQMLLHKRVLHVSHRAARPSSAKVAKMAEKDYSKLRTRPLTAQPMRGFTSEGLRIFKHSLYSEHAAREMLTEARQGRGCERGGSLRGRESQHKNHEEHVRSEGGASKHSRAESSPAEMRHDGWSSLRDTCNQSALSPARRRVGQGPARPLSAQLARSRLHSKSTLRHLQRAGWQ